MVKVNPPDLDQIRREIDGVDATLHDLLMQRARLVDQVRAAKAATRRVAMQPAREVAVIARLADRHQGDLPFQAVARIWREIVAAFTLMQGEMRVAVYAAGEEQGLWDLARDHFGSLAPMSAHTGPRDAFLRAARAEAEVAVLPWPRDEDEPWWPSLYAEDAPVIFVALPLVGPGNARGSLREGVAVGRVPLAATGRDKTLIAVETGEPLSRAGMSEVMTKAGLKHRVLASARPDTWLHLIEVDGFVTADDRRLELAEARDAVRGLRIVGAVSAPIGAA